MGTNKRARKKENRKQRLDQLARQSQRRRQRTVGVRIAIVLAIIVGIAGIFSVSGARYKYFDNTNCHRAIVNFVVQCGDPTATGSGGPGYQFADELPAAGSYKVGSIAMANSGPNTNGSQFFVITGSDGASLPPNYTLFGQVTEGL
ncbi:MAG: peptidylprolyl isomerase, partial [Actinobacteria bacterium]|nr:peptidylprolyl isomerase [Actinomycetota bacterium]